MCFTQFMILQKICAKWCESLQVLEEEAYRLYQILKESMTKK